MSGNMERVLRLMADKKASDVYLTSHAPIQIKINGQMLQLSDQSLTPEQPRQLLAELLTPGQLEELDEIGELNMGIGMPGVGSFRLSAFRQRGSLAAVFRCIPVEIPTLDSLKLPPILNTLILEKRGLIILAGATGTGKSTTLASMLEHRNRQMAGHMLTIEDPIEFLFTNKKSIVNQREVGRDVQSLQIGLKNALIIAGAEVDANFAMAARNIPNVDVLPNAGLNVYDVLRRDTLVLTYRAAGFQAP